MDLYQKQFEERESTSACWHSKSSDLIVSARTLWLGMDKNKRLEASCLSVYKMLMGMSFELLFKAHCVGAKIKFNQNHKLMELAKVAGLSATCEENAILIILSEYIIWDGRYSTPKKSQHLKNHWENESRVLNDKQQIGSLVLTTSNDELDFEVLLPMWRKFSGLYMVMYG